MIYFTYRLNNFLYNHRFNYRYKKRIYLEKNNILFFDLIKYKLKYFHKSKTLKINAVINGTFKIKAFIKTVR